MVKYKIIKLQIKKLLINIKLLPLQHPALVSLPNFKPLKDTLFLNNFA